MGITIDVVADTIYDWFAKEKGQTIDGGALAKAFKLHPNALRTLTVSDLVMKVETRAGGAPISLLRIIGHGSPGRQTVGGGANGDMADMQGFAQCIMLKGGRLSQLDRLARLKGRFAADGVVELHGCEVGQGPEGKALCAALAALWQVCVRAGFQSQKVDEDDTFEGPFIEAYPSGAVRLCWDGNYAMLPPALPKKPALVLPPIVIDTDVKAIHEVGDTVRLEDCLSKLSEKHYNGDLLLWPIIWDRNRSADFPNPNQIKPKQKIIIPKLPVMTGPEKVAMRQRGLNWRNPA